MTENTQYDICVIGGGINGAGIARDAALRGLSVLLVEMNDLASGTSSASTKLIHGGLRYLEYCEFRMVCEALKEREVLLKIAPHLIYPMDFVLPHAPQMRPWWMIRLGLFLYDHLARRKILPASRGLNLKNHPYGGPLKNPPAHGFQYADCWVDDARLVIMNALDAHEHGAVIRTHTSCTNLKIEDKSWSITLRDEKNGEIETVQASAVINASGPWVHDVLEKTGLLSPDYPVPSVRLVKGSHIIVKRTYNGDQAYILQQPDKRVVFVIPYERDYMLIGTTERDFEGDPGEAKISDEETVYLCDAYNAAFEQPITADDITEAYSGVRPLFDDGKGCASSVTRDYNLYHHAEYAHPLISLYGGKLTTYRKIAKETVSKIVELSGRTVEKSKTHKRPLPGGDIPAGDMDKFVEKQKHHYPWLMPDLLRRYARTYGTRMDQLLEGRHSLEDLGQHWGNGLYDAEVKYLSRYEWADNAEDILQRRTKLGLHQSEMKFYDV